MTNKTKKNEGKSMLSSPLNAPAPSMPQPLKYPDAPQVTDKSVVSFPTRKQIEEYLFASNTKLTTEQMNLFYRSIPKNVHWFLRLHSLFYGIKHQNHPSKNKCIFSHLTI